MATASAQIYMPVRNRVLIVSGDPLFRLRVMKKATLAECDCEQAVGGAHALAKLKQMSCTKVLLDRWLPDLDSAELAQLIQKRYQSPCASRPLNRIKASFKWSLLLEC